LPNVVEDVYRDATQENILSPNALPSPTSSAAAPRFHIRIIAEASRP
jgi:hypothetical protein